MIEVLTEGLYVALAGFASFLSPCVLPLVLPFAIYVAAAMATLGDKRTAASAAWLGLVFGVGFAVVFVTRGMATTAAGDAIQLYGRELTWLAGGVLMFAALHHLRLIVIPIVPRLGAAFGLGAVFVGAAFVFGWTPCAGPVLSAALTLTSQSSTAATGLAYLASYAAGLAGAFVIASALIAAVVPKRAIAQHVVGQVFGAALIICGAAILSGVLPDIGQWLLVEFPLLGRLESVVTPEALPGQMLRRASGL